MGINGNMTNNALDRHDQEIKDTLARIDKCIQNNSWNLVYDLTKYFNKLIKDRKDYVRFMKNARVKKTN